ncbi:response regulator [Pseudodesulfovibrio cashew]|uniref:Sensory/regulatory protein RpfC n=1 Tax=Pseudodesulfovibrio cashew TaxID=2678688 RepID=A0A6I6J8Q6_9BACT|nr:ATP-binding protein [Pseudodesulfovibrio cashew]QGY39216.1 response regulator [Pseudodesulfovibrio cashew]
MEKLAALLREPGPPEEMAAEFHRAVTLSNCRRLKPVAWLVIVALILFSAMDYVSFGTRLPDLWRTLAFVRIVGLAGAGALLLALKGLSGPADLSPRHSWAWQCFLFFLLVYIVVVVCISFSVRQTLDPVYLLLLGPPAYLILSQRQVLLLQAVGLSTLTGAMVLFAPPGVSARFHLLNVVLLTWVSLIIGRITRGGFLREFMNKRIIEKKHRQLEEARARAEAANGAKSDFLASMSHEIRTPMNSILGMTEALLSTPVSGEQREYVETARESARHLLGIIEDILDISRIEAGRLRLSSENFDLPEVVLSAVRTVRLQASQKGLDMDFEIMAGTPRFLKGDPGRLRQVLINLLGNSVKFTDRGSIRVTAGPYGGDGTGGTWVRFSVKDSGMGIPEDKARTIFEPFIQAAGSSSRSIGGSGLGLSICKTLVERMDGEIYLANPGGGGSEFVFTARFETGDGARVSKPSFASWSEPPPVRSSRVLLVEDNPVNIQVEKVLLERIGMVTEVAENGAEALRLLAEKDFDVVLMDLEMPGMDGYDVTRCIRSGEGGPAPVRRSDIPIVAVTAHALDDVRKRCERSGMNGFVTKPVGLGELGSALREVVGGGSVPEAPPTVEPEEAPVLDPAMAAEALGVSFDDVGFLIPKALEEIRVKCRLAGQGVASGALRETALQAHTLKSVAGTIGAERVRRAAIRLENAARREDAELSVRRMDELKAEVDYMERAAEAL